MEKTVTILSIGNASPVVSKILSDAFKLPDEVMLQKLYNAPSVFLQKVDTHTAQKAYDILSQLGLEVAITDADTPHNLQSANNKIDIAIYIPDPASLPLVANQLADFLGIDAQDAIQHLVQEPAVILGGVSEATANALQRRIDAEVLVSDPKKEQFTIHFKNNPKGLKGLDTFEVAATQDGFKIKGVDYKTSQKIWQQYGQQDQLRITNQAFERYQVVLEGMQEVTDDIIEALHTHIGMPKDIIPSLPEHLPIELEASLAYKDATALLEKLTPKEDLVVNLYKIDTTPKKIQIHTADKAATIKTILAPFFNDAKLNIENHSIWESPVALPHLIARYIQTYLSDNDITFETINHPTTTKQANYESKLSHMHS